MHEDGEIGFQSRDQQLPPAEELIKNFNNAVSNGLSFETAFDQSSMQGLSYAVVGNADFFTNRRFIEITRETYEQVTRELSDKKKGDMWSTFSGSLHDRWKESINRIKQESVETINSPQTQEVSDALWREVDQTFVTDNSEVIDIQPQQAEIDPILEDALVEEDALSAVNAREFWNHYREITNANPLNKTLVALEVIPTIDNSKIRGQNPARQSGVEEFADNNAPIIPQIVIFDVTDPGHSFVGGVSNRTAGGSDEKDIESHYLSRKGYITHDGEKNSLLSNKCTFVEGGGGELIMFAPVYLKNEQNNIYVSYFVRGAKYIKSNEIDTRKAPAPISPSF